MARTLHGDKPPRVGQIVYEPFAPAKVGIIVKAVHIPLKWTSERYNVDVRWFVKGKLGAPITRDSWSLNDYEALTEDHERKAVKFRNVINTIKSEMEKA